MAETLNLVKIYSICNSDNLVQQLQDWQLIPIEPTYKCPKCDGPLKLTSDTTKVDGYLWRCRAKVSCRKQATKQCNTNISIRTGTIFERSHLSLFQIFKPKLQIEPEDFDDVTDEETCDFD